MSTSLPPVSKVTRPVAGAAHLNQIVASAVQHDGCGSAVCSEAPTFDAVIEPDGASAVALPNASLAGAAFAPLAPLAVTASVATTNAISTAPWSVRGMRRANVRGVGHTAISAATPASLPSPIRTGAFTLECDTPRMEDLLVLARGMPTRTLAPGDKLVVRGAPETEFFVLIDGALRVEQHGTEVATIREPGACVGEIALLLGTAATADVVAEAPCLLAVVEDAPALLLRDPQLGVALARLLASRLQIMTSYLADLREQYAGDEAGLGLLDVLLGALMHTNGTRMALGARREPGPE